MQFNQLPSSLTFADILLISFFRKFCLCVNATTFLRENLIIHSWGSSLLCCRHLMVLIAAKLAQITCKQYYKILKHSFTAAIHMHRLCGTFTINRFEKAFLKKAKKIFFLCKNLFYFKHSFRMLWEECFNYLECPISPFYFNLNQYFLKNMLHLNVCLVKYGN